MDFAEYAFARQTRPTGFPCMRHGDRLALYASNSSTILWCHADYLGLVDDHGAWSITKTTEQSVAKFLEMARR